jgi:hypothetical protein
MRRLKIEEDLIGRRCGIIFNLQASFLPPVGYIVYTEVVFRPATAAK